MEQSDVRHSPFQHVLCGFLLAAILLATVFLFMQNSWGTSPSAVSLGGSSSSMVSSAPVMVGFPTHGAAVSSTSTTMIGFPVTSPSASSTMLVSTSSSSAPMIGFPVNSSSVSSTAVASLSSSYSSSVRRN